MKRSDRKTWAAFTVTITVRGDYDPGKYMEDEEDERASKIIRAIEVAALDALRDIEGAEVEVWPQ